MKVVWLFLSSLLYTTLVASIGTTSTTQLQSTFRSSKNIVFGAFVPGSSHTSWVLRFLDELASRGHNTAFITVDKNLKFGAAYPRINTILTGVTEFNEHALVKDMSSHADPLLILPRLAKVMAPVWKPCYETLMDYMDKNKVDVLICDHISDACRDAAIAKNVPMVITSTIAVFSDAGTGYVNNNMINMDDFSTAHQSISLRLYNSFIAPLRMLFAMKPQLEQAAQLKRDSGLVNAHYTDNPEANAEHALKIISTVFGLETPRSIGPLVELVGPMLATEYSGLDAPFESYLSTHQRVVYVAFGQHAQPMTNDVELLLKSLIQQYEKGHIDGVIWSNRNAVPEVFPKSITSSYSGKTYDMADLFGSPSTSKTGDLKADIFVTQWSPQMAVLLHPTVLAFISHGGANSIAECLHAGKRLMFFSFFGDQVGNAKLLTRSGVSEYLDYRMDGTEISERMERLILDKDGSYQHNVQRYQALIQIHSKAAPARAADLVEEVAFTHVGKLLPHREDVGRQLSFLKRHNLDIYGIALLVVVSTFSLIVFGLFKLVCGIYNYQQQRQKIKTL